MIQSISQTGCGARSYKQGVQSFSHCLSVEFGPFVFNHLRGKGQHRVFSLDRLLALETQHVLQKLPHLRLKWFSLRPIHINVDVPNQRVSSGRNFFKGSGEVRFPLLFCDSNRLGSGFAILEATVADRRRIDRNDRDDPIEPGRRWRGCQLMKALLELSIQTNLHAQKVSGSFR